MFACSVIIIIKVAEQAKKFRPKTRSKYLNTNNNSNSNTSANGVLKVTAKVSVAAGTESKFSARTRNLALMLIPVNVMFLLFVGPVVIAVYAVKNLENDHMKLLVVEVLNSCNFTVNFVIYFLTSSKFREEFFKLLNEIIYALFRTKFNFKGFNEAKSNKTTEKTTRFKTEKVNCEPTPNCESISLMSVDELKK